MYAYVEVSLLQGFTVFKKVEKYSLFNILDVFPESCQQCGIRFD